MSDNKNTPIEELELQLQEDQRILAMAAQHEQHQDYERMVQMSHIPTECELIYLD